MEEWKEYKLEEISYLSTGFPFKGNKYSKDGIRVVRGDNVTIGQLRWDTEKDKRWNEFFERESEFSLRANDIVIGMDGSRVGMNRAQIKESDLPLLLAQRVACVRNNDKSVQKFLYYHIFSKRFVDYVKAIHTGTSIPHISLKQIGDFTIQLPSLAIQQKIANILSSLDDKIEVNRRINEQLEELAQALFKSWFVDFEPFKDGAFVESELGMIPEGWKVGTLGDLAVVVMGSSPAGSSYNTEGNGSIFYQGRTDFGFRFPCIRMYTTEPKRFAEPNSVLLSVRAPVGDVNIAFEKCCIGRGLASIKSNCNADSYTFHLMKSLKPILDNYNNEGTVFGCINKDALNNLSILVPTIEVIKEFEKIASSFNVEIRRRSEEIHHLTTLRDTLLPKLMSGEIDVSEVEV